MTAKQWHAVKPNNLSDYRELLDNEFIGGWDLKGRDGRFRDFHLTIASVEAYKPKRLRQGEKVTRFVVRFVQAEKLWLCGKTSAKTIKSLYGPPSAWPGKLVTLYYDEAVTFGNTRTGGIRVRPKVPGAAAPIQELESQPVDPEMSGRIEQARRTLADDVDDEPVPEDAPAPRPAGDGWGKTSGEPEPGAGMPPEDAT